MKYWCEWHYDNNPDLSGDKHIVYYDPNQQNLMLLPTFKFFDANEWNFSHEENFWYELAYIQNIISEQGKLFYGYVPISFIENYFDINTNKFKQSTVLTSSCFGDFANHTIYFAEHPVIFNAIRSEAVNYIKNTLINVPDKILDMYDNITYLAQE